VHEEEDPFDQGIFLYGENLVVHQFENAHEPPPASDQNRRPYKKMARDSIRYRRAGGKGTAMGIGFEDYLDVKFPLDERSLNPDARRVFFEELRARPQAAVLDLGAGAGANLRRLLAAGHPPQLSVTAVDLDAGLLALARQRTASLLKEQGLEVATTADGLEARKGRKAVAFHFTLADLRDFGTELAAAYDAVLAHAVLDLLPAATMARRIARWLAPGGLAYATLNYDGGTWLFPRYGDGPLEERILEVYDESMERRQVWGEPSAGARSGRRLHAAFLEAGLEMLAYGSSDWNLVPLRGAYQGHEAACLDYLLGLILGEAAASGEFAGADLEAWRSDRQRALAEARLGLVCHQIDLLARKPAAVTS
jgi:SAM-dependent methyltransferase